MNTEELLKQENQKVLLGDVYEGYSGHTSRRVDYIKNDTIILTNIEDDSDDIINCAYIDLGTLTQRGVYKNFQEITCPDGYEFTGEYRVVEEMEEYYSPITRGARDIAYETPDDKLYILKKLADIPTPKPEDLPLGYRLGDRCELSRPLICPSDLFYVLENSYAWKLIKIDVPKGFELVSNVKSPILSGEYYITEGRYAAAGMGGCNEGHLNRYQLKKIETWRPVRGLEDIGKKARFKDYGVSCWDYDYNFTSLRVGKDSEIVEGQAFGDNEGYAWDFCEVLD